MNTKIILMNRDGTKAGEIPEISYDRVMDASLIKYFHKYYLFSRKIRGENAYEFQEIDRPVIVKDSEVV